jgi:hypothetical protein
MGAEPGSLEGTRHRRGPEGPEISATDDRGRSLAVASNPSTPPVSGWELALALGASRSDFASSYEHTFAPVFQSQPDATGVASQDLALAADDDTTWRLGLRRMLDSRLGLQLLLGRADAQLTGASSLYQVAIEYTSLQPPDYVPRPETFASSMSWPDLEGELGLDFLCVNAVVRVGTPNRVRFALSGGLTLFNLEADFSSLGYQTFWLGGHGVLFTEIYEIRVETDRARRLGANLGAEIGFPLGNRWTAFGEVRFFFSSSVDVELRAAEIVNRDRVISELPLEEIEPHLNLNRLELDPSFWTFSLGVRVGL